MNHALRALARVAAFAQADVRPIGPEPLLRSLAVVAGIGDGEGSELDTLLRRKRAALRELKFAFADDEGAGGARGPPGGAAGAATVEYLAAAVALTRAHPVHGIVACPHSETAVNAAGIAFSGYPGLLARLTGTAEEGVFLMLVGGGLRIVHATLHLPLRQARAIIDDDPDLLFALGTALRATHREKDARTVFEELRQLEPRYPGLPE